jgi:hypothetical protein
MPEKLRVGFFVYPWDLLADAAGQIKKMREELHCNAILLNAQYHHARLLTPRKKGAKTYQTSGAPAAFQPNPDWYQAGGLIPIPDKSLVDADVLMKAKAACQQHKMDFGLWAVGLHNSSLGRQNPDLCMENCFGDVYTYALCPSQQTNRQYLKNLVSDLCQQFKPDRLAVEATGFLGLRHWDHHELFMTEWDQALEVLTGICFCSACAEKGEKFGINVPKLREEISRWADALLNEERGALPEGFRAGDVASLLIEIDDLRAYLKMGEDTVTNLAVELNQVAEVYEVELEVIPASFHRPSSNAWMERASISALGKVGARLMVSSYFVSAAEVEADLRWVKHLTPQVEISAGINACAPTPSAPVLEGFVRAALAAGADSVYYYNYGLLTQRRLGWVAQVNRNIFG